MAPPICFLHSNKVKQKHSVSTATQIRNEGQTAMATVWGGYRSRDAFAVSTASV